MKRLLLILVACQLSLLALQAQSLNEKYSEKRPVVIVCDWDKPPYEFLNDKGEPAGSNVDIMRAVMKQLGLPCRFVMKEWSIALKTFERKKADIVLANARRYRKGPYVVSDNILNYNRIRVAMYADSSEMVSIKRLEQEGAVFKPGDYSANYFRDGDSVNISFMEFQSPKVALMGLVNGDYKYYVWGEEPLKWKIKELNLKGITLNDVGIPISEIHFVGHDHRLIEQIDDQFSRLKQSGEIAVLQDKWFHPERVHEKSSPRVIYITLAVLGLLGLVYLFNRLARAHVQRALRDSSELNEMMQKALHMGSYKVMEYDIANDRMTNRYGDIIPEEGITLEEFTRRIHPNQQEEFRMKMKRLMEGRERHFELDKRWNAGTDEEPQWLIFQGRAISELNHDGHPAYVVNAIHDITQDIEEDKAAKELVKKYERLSNMPFVAMSFYSKDGWLLSLNDRMKELCQMNDDNPETKRFWEKICMFDAPLFRNIFTPNSIDDMLFCQHMCYPDMDIDNYIECQIRPLFNTNSDVTNYFVSSLEITDIRNNEHHIYRLRCEDQTIRERIRQQDKWLEYLLRNCERHLVHSDLRQQTIAFYRSPKKPEHVHRHDEFLAMLREDDRETVGRLLTDTGTTAPCHCVFHLIRQSEGQQGSVFDITLNPIYDVRGKIVGHEGICQDITTVYNTKIALDEETRRANESSRLKSGFMASMTHELRTPLNAIVGFTGVLQSVGDMPEREEYVRIIRNSSDMLQRLINDIIEASTFTNGSMAIVPEPVEFSSAFEDIFLTLEQRTREPGVLFVKENPYSSLVTSIDINRVQQVLTNFVTNALKFTKQGHIKLGYRYENQGLYLFCEDTGKGIPKDKQDIVFERFVKLDEFVQGTGMGLAICKQIADSCNGKIGVDSPGEGLGSTFWMWIPCKKE